MRRRTIALGALHGLAALAALGITSHVAHAGRRALASERSGLDTSRGWPSGSALVRGAPGTLPFREIAPGLGLGRLDEAGARALKANRPDLDFSILPAMHLATDIALPILGVPPLETQGLTGKGTIIGVVDSGFDVTHSALRDQSGKTRFDWLLDYSRRTRGEFADLEKTYGLPECLSQNADGTAADGGSCAPGPDCSLPCEATYGAVFSGEDIDGLLTSATPAETLPFDLVGHGTHAMGIVGGSHLPGIPYRGVAPEARMIGVKGQGSGITLSSDSVLLGVKFIFDRADFEKMPASVNLSLAADFVVRDGTDTVGPAVAALAGGQGHVIVAAAGNSGDPTVPTHQTVHVSEGESVLVPLHPIGDRAQVFVGPHPGSSIRVGCDSPSGPWVLPVAAGVTRSAAIDGAVANVVFDPADSLGMLPTGSTSALVVMAGTLDSASDYNIVLEGSGTADLWLDTGSFVTGVREQTVGSPAFHPAIIAVGATATRNTYHTIDGEDLELLATQYDQGGLLRIEPPLPAESGQVAAYSGAGPGPAGGIKPDLLAPGVAVMSAASHDRDAGSLFNGNIECGTLADGGRSQDPQCSLVDADHGAGNGTSFAAPFVTGAAALLLQVNPLTTQEEARIALQAGVHRNRAVARFPEAGSVGELDVPTAVAVLNDLRETPTLVTPVRGQSWLTPSSSYALADGSRPLTVLFNLRGDANVVADGFDVDRFAASIDCEGTTSAPSDLHRVGPGLWQASFAVPDRATSALTIHALFDGSDVADPVTLPIANDPWQAFYPTSASGASCAAAPGPDGDRPSNAGAGLYALAVLGLFVSRARRS